MRWPPAWLTAALGVLAGCQVDLPVTPLQDVFHVDAAATRASYAPGDSVFILLTNRDSFAYIWHRCPGIFLERQTGGGWIELPDDGGCTPGSIDLGGGTSLTLGFVMPRTAPVGRYRAQVRLSPIDAGTKQFWLPSSDFLVVAP